MYGQGVSRSSWCNDTPRPFLERVFTDIDCEIGLLNSIIDYYGTNKKYPSFYYIAAYYRLFLLKNRARTSKNKTEPSFKEQNLPFWLKKKSWRWITKLTLSFILEEWNSPFWSKLISSSWYFLYTCSLIICSLDSAFYYSVSGVSYKHVRSLS